MRKSVCSVVAATLVTLMASASPALAVAEDSAPTNPVLEALGNATAEANAPYQSVLSDVASTDPNPDVDAIAATVNNVDVRVPFDPSDRLTLDTAVSGSISLQLPFADDAHDAVVIADGIVAYDNRNGSLSVPVVKTEGSLQVTTVIVEASAPTEYRYDLTIPEGGAINELDNGALVIVDENGSFRAGIAPAWAKDANGAEVPTHYVVNGSSVTQVVEHGPTVSYPVVADPYLSVQMVKGVYWEKRDPRGLTLVVTPTDGARLFGGAYLAGVGGWPEVEARVGDQSVQMEWQYICHQQFAFLKATWNLDTWVSRNSYADSIANKCN